MQVMGNVAAFITGLILVSQCAYYVRQFIKWKGHTQVYLLTSSCIY